MAEVLLFHHAHGLTSGVRDFANKLGRAGHAVHLPDLYEGRIFDSLEAGVMSAQMLAQTRLCAKGALLFHACLPTSEFGGACTPAASICSPTTACLHMTSTPPDCSQNASSPSSATSSSALP